MCYLFLILFIKSNFYSLIIPLDLIYTIYLISSQKDYFSKLQNSDFYNKKNYDKQPVIKDSLIVNDEYNNNNNNTFNIPDFKLTKESDIKSLLNEINTSNQVNKNTIKIKYIPHKLNIHSSLQQTVRNLGI